MPTLADLLTPETVAALREAPTKPNPPTEDGTRTVERKTVRGVVTKPATAACGNACGRRVTVPANAAGRRVVCQTCSVALTKNEPVVIVPSPPTIAPMGVTTTRRTVTAIQDMSSAQLGEVVKQSMRDEIAAGLPAKRDAAVAEQARQDKADRKAKRKARKAMTALGVLPEFTVKGRFVPALDVTALESLDEAPSPKVRSPYNKALYILGEALLPKTEVGIDQPVCTYRLLVETHQRLLEVASQQPAEPAPVIVAEVDLDEKALRKRQIATIRKATGCDKATAKRILATV